MSCAQELAETSDQELRFMAVSSMALDCLLMFDHVNIAASDFEKSLEFYTAALAPLGYKPVVQDGAPQDKSAGFGLGKNLKFWVVLAKSGVGHQHIAFSAEDHSAVDAFYAAALASGGRDNGGPGLRPNYHESYYAAFVFDPDGNNIEAVCHLPGRQEDQFAQK